VFVDTSIKLGHDDRRHAQASSVLEETMRQPGSLLNARTSTERSPVTHSKFIRPKLLRNPLQEAKRFHGEMNDSVQALLDDSRKGTAPEKPVVPPYLFGASHTDCLICKEEGRAGIPPSPIAELAQCMKN
jgi:hypothetical protein